MSSHPCPDACTCGRHDRVKLRGAALKRWEKATPADREAQAAVIRASLMKRWASEDEMRRQQEGAGPTRGLRDQRVWPEGDVFEIAARLKVTPPQVPTLRRYGLTQQEWLEMLAAQGWACAVCRQRTRGLVTDHEHVRGWKHMPPEERRRYVRGILCKYDNYRIVPSRMSAEEAHRMVTYLNRYEARRDA